MKQINDDGSAAYQLGDPIFPEWEYFLRQAIAAYEIDTQLVKGWLVVECKLALRPQQRNARLLHQLTCGEAINLMRQIWEWNNNRKIYEPSKGL